ncbi:MAG: glycosyltransferase family 2 protein [Propionibacteriaceae bacterium]
MGAIGIVVVNYASSELIRANLDVATSDQVRVVVVDNFSSEAERASITAITEQQGWTLVAMPDNRGFGPGVNAGVRAASELGCACFLLLNPDCVVSGATVEQLRLATLADEQALVAPLLVDTEGRVVSSGNTINLLDGRIRSLRSTQAHPDPRARPVTWLTAACLTVHRSLWERTGGFDETYFMYWEDVDFTFRALEVGGHVVVRDDLTGVHDQGGTQGPRRGRAKSDLYYFYNCRNRMLFAVQHLGSRDVARWWLRTPRVSWEILLHGGRRQLVESPRPAWSAARGGLAGMGLAGVRVVRRALRRR